MPIPAHAPVSAVLSVDPQGRLVDGLGRAVIMRGLNTGGRSKFAPFLPFDVSDPDDLVVRFDPATFTPVFAADLVELLRTHPDAYVILDTKLDHVERRLDELIVEARSLRAEYQAIERRVSYLEGRFIGGAKGP